MPTDVVMPQMGESIAEGTIVKWLKKVGDTIGRDEPLLEVSTDKVDTEVPSPAAGVITEILHQEGETVAVNAVLARIGEAGAAPAEAPQAEPAAAAPVVPGKSEVGPAREEPLIGGAEPDAKPLAPPAIPAAPATPAAPPAAPPAAAPVSASAEEHGKVRSSPLVRNIAREHGVNLGQITGTGQGGRVTKDDILNFIAAGKTAAAPVAAPVAAAPTPTAPAPMAPPPAPVAAPSVPAFATGDRVTVEPMSNMRKRIAENMLTSRRTSAHVTTFFEADFTNIARLRERVKKQFEAQNGTKLTFLPFVIKATLDALKALPIINASVDGDSIAYKHDFNIGIAVALDWGLIVPVIKNADMLSITGLARASQDLANRARAKQLKPDEISGGTFSITNFGLYGGYTATPIINQPQVAILGLGGIHKKPWVVETPDGEALAIRHIGVLSLSFDHRIIDGAVGDQFLAHIKKTIETTDFSALL
ncbi:MAG: 2-oxoglutarate dehydrogenase, E2 component, dihydrolipoamide succinyltransferase [Acidobacteria bacterium]|nr:2-oxoglutarate dehydrogenase, E2 component, dihydrolipoamide succinyltransferase [Acidobacteriota bacterium]MBI3424024.1 2-oxoglutarate dehydrogenase, E2 component, dihydrolipoamide succinyltransferase [Acidobacteriota bacterium]